MKSILRLGQTLTFYFAIGVIYLTLGHCLLSFLEDSTEVASAELNKNLMRYAYPFYAFVLGQYCFLFITPKPYLLLVTDMQYSQWTILSLLLVTPQLHLIVYLCPSSHLVMSPTT